MLEGMLFSDSNFNWKIPSMKQAGTSYEQMSIVENIKKMLQLQTKINANITARKMLNNRIGVLCKK